MKDIAIYGAGGFGREVVCLIEAINKDTPTWNLIGFFDDNIIKGTIINDIPVLGGEEDICNWSKELYLVLAIGSPEIKKNIFTRISNPKIFYPTLIHPSALLGNCKFIEIGKGCIICAGVILTVNIEVGDFVIFNLDCTVGHDSVIGSYSSFMPTVNISGEVTIGEEVYIGTGAKIINQLSIGEKVIIGAGAVVAKSLPSCCTAVGIPAKPIKYHKV